MKGETVLAIWRFSVKRNVIFLTNDKDVTPSALKNYELCNMR